MSDEDDDDDVVCLSVIFAGSKASILSSMTLATSWPACRTRRCPLSEVPQLLKMILYRDSR